MSVLIISCLISVSPCVFGASGCSYYALKEYFVDTGVVFAPTFHFLLQRL